MKISQLERWTQPNTCKTDLCDAQKRCFWVSGVGIQLNSVAFYLFGNQKTPNEYPSMIQPQKTSKHLVSRYLAHEKHHIV